MQFTSINIVHDYETGEIDYYIVSYTHQDNLTSINGQIQIDATDATLSNITEVARAKLIELVNS